MLLPDTDLHARAAMSNATVPAPIEELGDPPSSLADVLKDRTREAHSRAERHPMQVSMVSGGSTREQYAGWLGQMLHIWRAVDAGLADVAAREPRLAAMLQPYHPHAERVAADLRFLAQESGRQVGPHGNDPALPATARFVHLVRQAASAPGMGLVGIWYVLEGSANGGRFIAKALSRGLGIEGPEGLTSFNPHGERQREYWQAWRAALDSQTFSATERATIVSAASATFDAIYDVMEDLGRAS